MDSPSTSSNNNTNCECVCACVCACASVLAVRMTVWLCSMTCEVPSASLDGVRGRDPLGSLMSYKAEFYSSTMWFNSSIMCHIDRAWPTMIPYNHAKFDVFSLFTLGFMTIVFKTNSSYVDTLSLKLAYLSQQRKLAQSSHLKEEPIMFLVLALYSEALYPARHLCWQTVMQSTEGTACSKCDLCDLCSSARVNSLKLCAHLSCVLLLLLLLLLFIFLESTFHIHSECSGT